MEIPKELFGELERSLVLYDLERAKINELIGIYADKNRRILALKKASQRMLHALKKGGERQIRYRKQEWLAACSYNNKIKI